MMMTLQRDLHLWRQRNFPTSGGPTTIPGAVHLLGAVEEIGELAKAHIKQEQGIRGTPRDWEYKAQDAVADTIIYLMEYCSDRGWDIGYLVNKTVQEVTSRDWIKFPFNGVDK